MQPFGNSDVLSRATLTGHSFRSGRLEKDFAWVCAFHASLSSSHDGFRCCLFDSDQMFAERMYSTRYLIVVLFHSTGDQIDDAKEQQHLSDSGDQPAGRGVVAFAAEVPENHQ
jgi:hypothetical protein